MSGNPVGEKGALAMAEMIKHNTTLEELNLREEYIFRLQQTIDHDDIGDNGIKALVESLAVNQHLKKLIIASKYKEFAESLSVYHDHKEQVEFRRAHVLEMFCEDRP